MKNLLWLDDYRNPFSNPEWLVFSPFRISSDVKVSWVKSYDEFISWINENGLPDGICFDHDLADYSETNKNEKTGYDCAKFLVEYCLERKILLPLYNVQSANPTGKENIISLLKNYNKFINTND